jgi:hypothetical protein
MGTLAEGKGLCKHPVIIEEEPPEDFIFAPDITLGHRVGIRIEPVDPPQGIISVKYQDAPASVLVNPPDGIPPGPGKFGNNWISHDKSQIF